ncbi:hypothetical protein EUGRSUZ_F00572 [Eucalyptus grandis]|uniref:Uncharacterized protein n=2 Tax=Eucalyptus grandis TaxID=71139 RepID=A0ACC3KCU2_EUCGR|nr:hypothetical protein EUGRSUZ_F00572 [Eucalyptus grandis]
MNKNVIVPMNLNCLRFPSRTYGFSLCNKSTNMSTALTSKNSDQTPHEKLPQKHHLRKNPSVQGRLLQRSHSAIPLLKRKR